MRAPAQMGADGPAPSLGSDGLRPVAPLREGPSRLAELGDRICVLGPSNSGKSTLAAAIGRARGLDAVHLDRLYHRPGTDWAPRPPDEFAALHDAAVAGEAWVMDGNYHRLMPRRLERATGLILLDASTATSLLRYLRRTLFEGDRREGGLPGAPEALKWSMVRHIAGPTRGNRRRYARDFAGLDLPKISLPTAAALRRFYRVEGLRRGA